MPSTGGWHFTQHALDRALDMALGSDEIRLLLSDPNVRQPSGKGYPEGYEIWSNGRIATVVVPDGKVVVTFLWRGVVYDRGTDSEPFRDN